MNPVHSLDTRDLFNDAIPLYDQATPWARSVAYHSLWTPAHYNSARQAAYKLRKEAKR